MPRPGGRQSARAVERDALVLARPYPVERFSSFLAARGVLPGALSTTSNEVVDADLEAFGEWLRRHRGDCEATIVNHLRRVGPMRAELGADPGRYDAASVRDVLLRRFATASRSHARALATSMRMYLRFLAARGQCPPPLVGAVPTAPGWRLCELPRYVSAVDIERVIASCNVTTPVGLRDRAILLLLARLALRAGDVVHLRLGDLDWENARVRVCGKSKTRPAYSACRGRPCCSVSSAANSTPCMSTTGREKACVRSTPARRDPLMFRFR